MKTSRSVSINLNLKQKWTWISAGGLLFAALFLTTNNQSFVVDEVLKVNENEIFVFGSNFENKEGGDFVNQGTSIYSGDILNLGVFDCGNCLSGSNYIRNEWGEPQVITGVGPVRMQDVILENEEGVDLELEWQITNSFDFVQGIVRTERDDGLYSFLHFMPGSIYLSTLDLEHVDGYVARSGPGNFILPTGDGERLMPVMITGSSANSMFKAAYYHADPNNGAMYPGGPFFTDEYDISEIAYVSPAEFWDIEGNSLTNLVLSWDQTSNISSWTNSIDSVIVVGWQNDRWVNVGQIYSDGNLQKGTVTSRSILPDEYDAFALGKMNPEFSPVVYLSFDAIQKGDDGYLFWSTTREINSFYFDVERSLDAIIFEKFGQVQAGGNTDTIQHYDFWDEGIAAKDLKRVFYRIRQVDLDGRFIYSQVEELVFGEVEEEIELTIFPNPVIDILRVRYIGRAALNSSLKMFNMLGQKVHEVPLQRSTDLSIDVSHLAIGHYVVVAGNDQIQVSKRLVIAR